MLWLKWLHLSFAAFAVGATLSQVVWRRATSDPLPMLKGMLVVDGAANVCYVLAFITGIGLAQMMGIPFSTLWVASAMILFVVTAAVGGGVYTPILRKTIAALEAKGARSQEYLALTTSERRIKFGLGLAGVLLIWIMVLKP